MVTGSIITLLLVVLMAWQLDSVNNLFVITLNKISAEDTRVEYNNGQKQKAEVRDREEFLPLLKERVSDVSSEEHEEHRTDPSETANQSGDSFFWPVPVLRPAAERTNQILKEIVNLKEINTQYNPRHIFALKTAVIENTDIKPELVFSVNSLLGQMELVRISDQGACDLLVAMNDNSQGKYLTIHSNLFGDEGGNLYQEHYNFENDQQLLTSLKTIILKYYCFNIIRSLDRLKPVGDGYDTAVTFKGGSNGTFQVGDTIEICTNTSRETYFMLLNANAEGLYMLFPQTRDEHTSLISGKPFCTGPMAVSPPTGNELIAGVMFTDKLLLPIDQYLAGDEQIIIEPASWPYNLHVPDNAVQYCERLFTTLNNALTDEYSFKSRVIKTYPILSLDQASDYRELGIEFFKKKKYLDAITELFKAANVNPDDEIAIKYLSLSYFKQAMILFDKKKYLQAKEAFETSLQYDEDCNKCSEYIENSEKVYKKFHYDKGISYFGDEQLAEAIFEWELVHTLDPNYEKIESNLKKAKVFLNKLEQIEKDQ